MAPTPFCGTRPFYASCAIGYHVVLSCWVALWAARLEGANPSAKIDFNRDIQPILSENCYHCHGPDAKARKAKLRLDQRDGVFEKHGEHDPVVLPGKPAESELIIRILSTDPDEMMPAPDSNRKLTARQKELLQHWVEQGAPWAEHWAFMPPQRPPLPELAPGLIGSPGRLAKTSRHPIDAFVHARLAEAGLAPSAAAPKEKLIRRAALDLTGLPPTAAQTEAFLADPSTDAYEKLIDRLLASPRYGERMVWDWLDAARYADTNGFQNDPTRTMWPWRDWVIGAFNRNMPFDQFTIEQLAGDLLPNATRDQKLATGFNRNHMINNEGGSIVEESRVSYVVDRVDTTSTVWLGMTIGCARCHDHKFDPVTQREYFQLYAYFNQVPERGNADALPMANPVMSLASAQEDAQVAELRAAEAALKKKRDAIETRLLAAQPEWERTLPADGPTRPEPNWVTVTGDELASQQGATLTAQSDGSVLVSGLNPETDNFTFTGRSEVRGITAIRLELLVDPSLPRYGPGRAVNGNFILTEMKIQADGRPLDLTVVDNGDPDQLGNPATAVVDGNPATGWTFTTRRNQPMTAIFELRAPVSSRAQTTLAIRLEQQSKRATHTLGKFRFSVTDAPVATLRALSPALRAVLALPVEQRSPAQAKELSDYYVANSSDRLPATKLYDAAKKKADDAFRGLLKVMVMADLPEPRDTFILQRGAYDNPGEKVSVGTPKILPALPADAPRNRLALARWLVSPDHPLTARVTVNRLWALFFGTGLVKTVSDFGLQGDKPSHPELLDWLAREFVESGWDIKQLVKLIMTSATYQQSSQVTTGLFERDPENRLLARGPRFRLPSWMIRDQALAASGLLVEKIGGPSVNGYQPPGIWEEATFGKIRYKADEGEALYRRSVYTFWRRIVGPTMFFDTANRQTCSVEGTRTNTPLHALTTLNDVTYVEASRALAERTLREGGSTDRARLAYAFRLCTVRNPTPREATLLAAALQRQQRHFAADPAAAKTLIAAGESKPDPQLDPVTVAAYTAVASLMLNLDETLTKE